MNKTEFIKELERKTDLSLSDCEKVNNILEHHNIFNKSNKSKIASEIMQTLSVNETKGKEIYDVSMSIINTELKFKIKYPFSFKN